MINWTLERRKIDDLTPHPKNPRKLSTHDAEHLEKSLERFGLIDKPIINPNGQIIGGHQRLSILRKMYPNHEQFVDCWVPHRPLDEKEVEELNIRLNKSQGSFDWDILADQYEIDDLFDWGFTPEECALVPFEEIDPKEDKPKAKKKHICPQCGHEF